MSAIAPLLEDKRTSNAADLTASIYEYTIERREASLNGPDRLSIVAA
jgi:hypothetical protein